AAERGAVSGIEAEEGVEGALSVAAGICAEEGVVASVGNLSTSAKTNEEIVVWARPAHQHSVPVQVVLRLRVEDVRLARAVNVEVGARLLRGLILNKTSAASATAASRGDRQRVAGRRDGHV